MTCYACIQPSQQQQWQQQHRRDHQNSSKNIYSCRQAVSTAEYRAAGFLRADSFFTPRPVQKILDRTSSYFTRRAIQFKADEKWHELEDLVAANSNHPQHQKTIPILATSTEPPSEQGTTLSLNIPEDAQVCLGSSNNVYAVATLDVNIGIKLPSEELIGTLPISLECAATKRAYLSNVCTLKTLRQQGIALHLIQYAIDTVCRQHSIRHVYVHVVHTNEPALSLYTKHCGFEIESEEKPSVARALNRPRRLLLHRSLSL